MGPDPLTALLGCCIWRRRTMTTLIAWTVTFSILITLLTVGIGKINWMVGAPNRRFYCFNIDTRIETQPPGITRSYLIWYEFCDGGRHRDAPTPESIMSVLDRKFDKRSTNANLNFGLSFLIGKYFSFRANCINGRRRFQLYLLFRINSRVGARHNDIL